MYSRNVLNAKRVKNKEKERKGRKEEMTYKLQGETTKVPRSFREKLVKSSRGIGDC